MAKEIPLTKGYVAIVDDEDYERVAEFKWHAVVTETGLVRPRRNSTKECQQTELHRFILEPKDGEFVDHINGDTLDNRRANLRVCNKSQNAANTPKTGKKTHSKYKGVSYLNHAKKWLAYIRVNYKQKHLGYFTKQEEAAKAYDIAAEENFGEFARLNFPRKEAK